MSQTGYFDRDYAAVVTELYEGALNGRDPWRADELFHPDAVVHYPGTGERFDDCESFVRRQAQWLDAVPDYHVAVDDVVVGADRAVARLTVSGTPVKPWGGVRPTGRSFRVPAVHEFRFEDGKVAEAWLLTDRMAMARQLGLLPGSVGDLLRAVRDRLAWLLVGRQRTAHGRAVEPPPEATPTAAEPREEHSEPEEAPAEPSPSTAASHRSAAAETVNKDSEVDPDQPADPEQSPKPPHPPV